MASIKRGDNTKAFGGDFLRIYLNNPNQLVITKAVLQVNNSLEKTFENPRFPLRVNFTGAETELLDQMNTCRLALWDEKGRRRTADGKFTFLVKENQITEEDNPTGNDFEDYLPDNSITFDVDDVEFAAEFVVNVTPTKMSELEQDVCLMKPENIIAGRNVTITYEDETCTINADSEVSCLYEDLPDKPSINGVTLEGDLELTAEDLGIGNADWTATEGSSMILNKPFIAAVGLSNDYNDLDNKPTIVNLENISELENDAGYITSDVSDLTNYYDKTTIDDMLSVTVDLSGVENILEKHEELIEQLQSDLDEKLDTETYEIDLATLAKIEYVDEQIANLEESKLDKDDVGDGTLTIQINGNTLKTFTANSTNDVIANIPIPTSTSELTNDSGYITQDSIDLSDYVTNEDLEEQLEAKADLDIIGDGKLIIRRNGTTVTTFTANTANNAVADITVPTKVSELTNDSEYITEANLDELQSQIDTVEETANANTTAIEELQSEIDNKVDSVEGYELISTTLLNTLSSLQNYDDTELRTLVNDYAELVTALESELDNKVDKEDGKGLSTNDFTDDYQNQIEDNTSAITTLQTTTSEQSVLINKNASNITSLQSDLSDLEEALANETTNREDEDNYLQEQIDALTVKATVIDILTDYDALGAYDTSDLKEGEKVCVIKDDSHNDTTTYYNWNGSEWEYIGSEGEYYTKSETNEYFVPVTRTINGYALDSDITLDYEDVGALSDTTVIGDGTLTIQVNSESLGTFTSNQELNTTVNIAVPTAVSELENDVPYVDETTFEDQVAALQTLIETNATNIATNVTAIESLNSLITGSLDGLPTVALTGSYNDLTDTPDIPTKVSELENDVPYLTEEDLTEALSSYSTTDAIPTAVSELENDRGYVTSNAIGKAVYTLIYTNETELGTIDVNGREDTTIEILLDSELSTESTNPVQNNIITTEMNLKSYDVDVVHLEGTEEITGDKTFTGTVTLNTATGITLDNDDNSTNLATTAYVQNQDYCTNTDAVHIEGTETITGDKTFTGSVGLLGTTQAITQDADDSSSLVATTEFVKSQNYAVDSTVVHITGDETINGNKTFAGTVTLDGIVYLNEYAHVTTPDEDSDWYSTDLVVNVEYVQTQISEVEEQISTLDTQVSTNTENISTHALNIESLENSISDLSSDRYYSSEDTIDLNSIPYIISAFGYNEDGKTIITGNIILSKLLNTSTFNLTSFVANVYTQEGSICPEDYDNTNGIDFINDYSVTINCTSETNFLTFTLSMDECLTTNYVPVVIELLEFRGVIN